MSVVPIGRGRWPSGRGSRASFARRFGAARTDRLHAALTGGDPLADALVAIDGARGVEVRRQLARGLASGLASLEDPDESVAALLADVESVPPHVDEALIRSGPPGWYAVPLPVHLASMSAGALIGLYASPSIAGVLTSTRCLLNDTEHRLRETARWLSTAMLPGSLAPGEAGYAATVKVRVLHAHMRRAARRRGHDERMWGTPVSQADLAFTWLGFTLTSMRAEASAGFGLTADEISGNYRYWWQLAHLLGIDAALVGSVRDHDDAERLERMLRATLGDVGHESADLTERTLRVAAEELERMIRLPGGTGDDVLRALVGRFHGAANAEALGAGKPTAIASLMTPVAAAARLHRHASRRDTTRWQSVCTGRVDEALAQAEAAPTDGPDAYERLAETLDASAGCTRFVASGTLGETAGGCPRGELPEAA